MVWAGECIVVLLCSVLDKILMPVHVPAVSLFCANASASYLVFEFRANRQRSALLSTYSVVLNLVAQLNVVPDSIDPAVHFLFRFGDEVKCAPLCDDREGVVVPMRCSPASLSLHGVAQ